MGLSVALGAFLAGLMLADTIYGQRAMTEVLPEAQKTALLGRIPAGKLGEGNDVAAAVVYLASREAGYVTGQTLHVNGGMAML